MFLSINKKNNAYPCKPQCYYIKVGFKGSILYKRVFLMFATTFYNYCLTFSNQCDNFMTCLLLFKTKFKCMEDVHKI